MAYAINPYSGQQMPVRQTGGPVNPAPGPGGGIGGGPGGGAQQGLPAQTGGMFGTGGGYMGMPQGPIPSGLAAFKDPRVLMMLSGVASGASQGRNPLSGAIQGGFGAVGSLADMEQQAQRNKMTQREMEFAEQQEERRQRRFESEEERIQSERDREEREREAVRNFLGRFSNGGMGTKQGEGEGTPAAGRTPGGGMRQGLVQLGMEAPGMADYAIKNLTQRPDPTTLQRNIEYMQSLPPGDPRREMMERSMTKPQVEIRQGADTPDLPANYMWETPEDPAKSGYAIKGLPGSEAERIPAGDAGKSAMLAVASRNMKSVRNALIDDEGNVNNLELASTYYNIPRTDGRIIRSQIDEAIDAKTRLETGAGLKGGELERLVDRYIPPPWARADEVKEAIDSLERFINTALEETNPDLYRRLRARAGTGPSPGGRQQVQEASPQNVDDGVPVYRIGQGDTLERVR